MKRSKPGSAPSGLRRRRRLPTAAPPSAASHAAASSSSSSESSAAGRMATASRPAGACGDDVDAGQRIRAHHRAGGADGAGSPLGASASLQFVHRPPAHRVVPAASWEGLWREAGRVAEPPLTLEEGCVASDGLKQSCIDAQMPRAVELRAALLQRWYRWLAAWEALPAACMKPSI